MKQSINSKTGNAPLQKIGHTYSNQHGSTPMARRRGGQGEPTEQSFK